MITHSLRHETTNQTYRYTPQADGSVTLDWLYPNGLPGYCYRPGVGKLGRRMSRKAARAHYAEALRCGWAKA